MSKPFFDTRNLSRLRLVCNLLTYPHEFCCKESNVSLLTSALGNHSLGCQLIEILRGIQFDLHERLPLQGIERAWKARKKYLRSICISTDFLNETAQHEPFDSLKEKMDEIIIESVIERIPSKSYGKPSYDDIILACKSTWLSEILALLVLGIAKVDRGHGQDLLLKPANEHISRHLRRLWFGVAFDEASKMAASISILRLKEAFSKPISRSELEEAWGSALGIFPQHWRLPADNGPVSEVLFSHFKPLLEILIYSIIESTQPGKLKPFGRGEAKNRGVEKIFNEIHDMQSELPIVDRLFDVIDGRLKLGTGSIAPGIIAIAERLTLSALGKDWHGPRTSKIQKEYVIERLRRNPYVEILDFELLQHNTDNNIDVDIDFFVRDKGHSQIYGVQLKHLESNFKSSILHWITRFRDRNSGLGNLVRQLENVREIGDKDLRARERLIKGGVSSEECRRIVPVGLHNLGSIDFWEVQNGVLLYDIHTFSNVLAGRIGVASGVTNGTFFNIDIAASSDSRPSPHSPDVVIEAYLQDPKFSHLLHFDMAKACRRRVTVGGVNVIAEGLGV